MTAYQNKHIDLIKYNHLNLPIEIQFGNGKIYYTYDAAGTKLKKQVHDGGTITRTDYVSGYQYKDNVLQFFPTTEGYVNKEVTGYKYVYNYTDHLGNVRLSYADNDGNGSIDTSEILEENNYYAFGLKHKGYNGASIANEAYKYKYNGKELQDELGLDWYDYGARNYDASLGRWMNVDPLSEQARNWTPYRYSFNNPINIIDPDGRFEFILNKDKNGNLTSLSLNKSTDKKAPEQNMERFMLETGLSKRGVRKLFGGKDKANDFFNGDASGINVSDLQGKMGEKLQQVEKSILEYNNEPGLANSNCGGTAISLGTDNKIDRELTLGYSPVKIKRLDLKTNLDADYVKKDNFKMGDLRFYYNKKGDRWHAATVLLKNHRKTQVFYKRNGSSQGKYMINSESSMRSADKYDGVIDGNYRKKL